MTHDVGSFRLISRWGGVALFVAFWATTAWFAVRDKPIVIQPVAGTANSTSSTDAARDCAVCHEEIAAAWAGSAHAHAATNQLFLARMRVSGNEKDCLPCHAPLPVLRTGLTNPVRVRRMDVEAGVTCASCHELPDGGIAASTSGEAPCHPTASARLMSNALCGSCHRAIYRDVLAQGKRGMRRGCVDCHMRSDAATADARPADHSFATRPIGSAVELRVWREGGIVVEVANNNPAHAFPGDRHNRVVLLRAECLSDDGAVIDTWYDTVREVIPFRAETPGDEIPPSGLYRHVFPNHAGRVRVSLLYKRVPWLLTSEATVVSRAELPPEAP